MYLWNYISNELAENGQPATASIGFYDEPNNVIIFTVNENKWQTAIPEGINTREAMILFMVANVPILKDFIDKDDIEKLFNAPINETAPVVPESVPVTEPESVPYTEEASVDQSEPELAYEQSPAVQPEAVPYYNQAPAMPYYEQEPVPQPEPVLYNEQATIVQPEVPQQPKEMKIVRCEKCGLFYDNAEYDSCPFCEPEVSAPVEIINEPVIEQVNNEAETIIDLPPAEENINNIAFASIPSSEQTATVNFYINDGLYASAKAREGEEVSLGRADFCTIFCAEEKQLSRVHCTIQYNAADNSFSVNDKSLNGIFDYTGNRLPKDTPVIVPSGTCLWIATKSMMLELKAPETVPVVVPAPEEDILITGQVQEQNICCVCGGEYTSDSLFCPWCGNKLTT